MHSRNLDHPLRELVAQRSQSPSPSLNVRQFKRPCQLLPNLFIRFVCFYEVGNSIRCFLDQSYGFHFAISVFTLPTQRRKLHHPHSLKSLLGSVLPQSVFQSAKIFFYKNSELGFAE